MTRTAPPPFPALLCLAAAACGVAGCGAGRLVATHRPDDTPPPGYAAAAAPPAATRSAAGSTTVPTVGSAVRPAAHFAPAPQVGDATDPGGAGLGDLQAGDAEAPGTLIDPPSAEFDTLADPQATNLDTLADPPNPDLDALGTPPDAGLGGLPDEGGATDAGVGDADIPGLTVPDATDPGSPDGTDTAADTDAGTAAGTGSAAGTGPAGDGAAGGDAAGGGGAAGADDIAEEATDVTTPAELAAGGYLTLADVLDSAVTAFPLLEVAAAERRRAGGQIVEARGAFDTKLKAAAEEAPLGFYRNYREAAGVEQPIYHNGGEVFAAYRIGRGSFEPWYRERETNEGGEFKAGLTLPLLRGRRIDERRTALRIAVLERQAAEPGVRLALLEAVRDAALLYWEWVAAGRQLAIAEDLLRLALDRDVQVRRLIEEGETAVIIGVDNARLIADRRAKRIAAQRKLLQSAAKLSLYLRGRGGVPLVPADELLPPGFPAADESVPDLTAAIAAALANRPEPVTLELQRRQLEAARALACNDLLPDVDFGTVLSQDVGQPTSSKRDKSRFELDAALTFSVPLQRRKARGKILQAEGKLAGLAAKRRFTADKIAVEVRTAVASLVAAAGQIEQARRSLEFARRLERAEQREFDEGEGDLLRVNLREAATAAAAAELVEARRAYHASLAQLRAVLGGVDPPALPTATVIPPPPQPVASP